MQHDKPAIHGWLLQMQAMSSCWQPVVPSEVPTQAFYSMVRDVSGKQWINVSVKLTAHGGSLLRSCAAAKETSAPTVRGMETRILDGGERDAVLQAFRSEVWQVQLDC